MTYLSKIHISKPSQKQNPFYGTVHSGFGGLEVACWPLVPKFAGFKPSRSRRIFQGEKILSTPSFGREVKPFVPCRRFTARKRSLNVTWKSGIFRQNSSAIYRPSSPSFQYEGLWWRHLAVQVRTTKDQGLYNKLSAAVHPGALAARTLPQYNTMASYIQRNSYAVSIVQTAEVHFQASICYIMHISYNPIRLQRHLVS